MTAVRARKSGRIDSGHRNIFIGSVEQVHRLSESEPKIERFYPIEKFLEHGELRDYREVKNLLNSLHVSGIFDKFPIMLVAEIFEQNQDKQLVLGVDPL
jgi:hypothetical protein